MLTINDHITENVQILIFQYIPIKNKIYKKLINILSIYSLLFY